MVAIYSALRTADLPPKQRLLNLVSPLSLGCGAIPTKLAIRLWFSRPNSGSIAISVAVVIEPMPFDLLCHLGFAVKMRVGVVVDLFVQFVNQPVKWAISCLTLSTCVS